MLFTLITNYAMQYTNPVSVQFRIHYQYPLRVLLKGRSFEWKHQNRGSVWCHEQNFPLCSKTISTKNAYIIFSNWTLNNEINPMFCKLKWMELFVFKYINRSAFRPFISLSGYFCRPWKYQTQPCSRRILVI